MAEEPNFIACTGEIANHCEALPLDNIPVAVVGSSEDPFFPAENQINFNALEACVPWRGGEDNEEDASLTFDKNQIINPGAETGEAADWTSVGDVTIVTSPVHTGTYAFKLDVAEGEGENLIINGDAESGVMTPWLSSGVAVLAFNPYEGTKDFNFTEFEGWMYQQVAVTGGASYILRVAIDAPDESNVLAVEINLDEAQYLDPDGATWNASPSFWLEISDTAGYVFSETTVTIPGVGSQLLGFYFETNTSAPLYADAIEVVPLVAGASDMSQEVRARAGERVTLQGWLQALPAGSDIMHAYAYIKELGTNGGVLQPGGTFGDTDQDWATESDDTQFVLHTIDVRMPEYTVLVPGGVFTLIVEFYGQGYLDDVAFWHWTDLAAIVGHNVPPSIDAVEVRASTDNFSASDVLVTTFDPVHWPNTYELFTLRGERWWRFVFVGVSETNLWVGQCWLAQQLLFARAPNFGLEEALHRESKENWTSGGRRFLYEKEDIRRTDLIFTWLHPDEADFEEIRNRLFEQGGFGSHPALMIRSDDDPQAAHMVYIPMEYRVNLLETDVRAREGQQMTFPGLSYPSFTP